jgi:GTPase SAR1 family protein
VRVVQMGGQRVDLQLYDTAGQEDYDRLRPICYSNTGVFLLCFSLDDAENMRNVREKWQVELREHCPGVPVLLIGTKSDLRFATNASDSVSSDCGISYSSDNGDVTPTKLHRRHITLEEGECLAHDIGAVGYVECSAKRREGVQNVFALAALAALKRSTNLTQVSSSATTFAPTKVSKADKRLFRSQRGCGLALHSASQPLSKLCGDLSDNVKSLAAKHKDKRKTCPPKCTLL